MKILLVKKVNNLGEPGEIKDVADGYARNFLVPKGLARVATDSVIKQFELQKEKKYKKKDKTLKKSKELLKKINNLKIIMKAKAEEEKKTLFGSISAKDIADQLKERGYEIDAKYIKLDEPIKQLGYYDVEIEVGEEQAKVGLTVERE